MSGFFRAVGILFIISTIVVFVMLWVNGFQEVTKGLEELANKNNALNVAKMIFVLICGLGISFLLFGVADLIEPNDPIKELKIDPIKPENSKHPASIDTIEEKEYVKEDNKSITSNSTVVACPICNEMVEKKKLFEHVSKKH